MGEMAAVIPASLGGTELVILFALFLYIPAMVVTGMKGRWLWFILGLFLFPAAFVGAFLRAKPGSALGD
jgi:hypothetical protein